ncbi:hypothetical protein [Streptosporangium sp. NPDC023615]|uniref:hypothetical protein n=1 Tax=Streptosporangium sp. NPDC023615 TaxID=3154794 RepID=UPI0034164660
MKGGTGEARNGGIGRIGRVGRVGAAMRGVGPPGGITYGGSTRGWATHGGIG